MIQITKEQYDELVSRGALLDVVIKVMNNSTSYTAFEFYKAIGLIREETEDDLDDIANISIGGTE